MVKIYTLVYFIMKLDGANDW